MNAEGISVSLRHLRGMIIMEKIENKISYDIRGTIYKVHNNLGFRLDLLVEKLVIVEIKSVEVLAPVHHKQLLTYLKLSGLRLGILVNFNTDNLEENIVRIVNNL